MTDNIKAKGDELIEKFRNEYSWVEKDFPVDLWRDARQCAIIAVEEIIKNKTDVVTYMAQTTGPEILCYSAYWNEVLNYLKSKQ